MLYDCTHTHTYIYIYIRVSPFPKFGKVAFRIASRFGNSYPFPRFVQLRWTDIAKRPLINIIVTCRERPFFLRSFDCSGKCEVATFQFELLRDAIEEFGSRNVVQVVTDAAEVCKSIGLMIQSKYRHIF